MPKKINDVMTVDMMTELFGSELFQSAAKLWVKPYDFAEQAPTDNEELQSFLDVFVDNLISLHKTLKDENDRKKLERLETALNNTDAGSAVQRTLARRAMEDLAANDDRSLDEKLQDLKVYEELYKKITPRHTQERVIARTNETLLDINLNDARNTPVYKVVLDLFDQKRTNKSYDEIWQSIILRPYIKAFQKMLHEDRNELDKQKERDSQEMGQMLAGIVAKDKANELASERAEIKRRAEKDPVGVAEREPLIVPDDPEDLIDKIVADAKREQRREQEADQMLSDILDKDKAEERDKIVEETAKVRGKRDSQEMGQMLSGILTKDKAEESARMADERDQAAYAKEKYDLAHEQVVADDRRKEQIARMKRYGEKLQSCLDELLETMGKKAGQKFLDMTSSIVQLQDGKRQVGISSNIKEENLEMLRAKFEAARKATLDYINEKGTKFNAGFGVGEKRLRNANEAFEYLEGIANAYVKMDAYKSEIMRSAEKNISENKKQAESEMLADSKKKIGVEGLKDKAGMKDDSKIQYRNKVMTNKKKELGFS